VLAQGNLQFSLTSKFDISVSLGLSRHGILDEPDGCDSRTKVFPNLIFFSLESQVTDESSEGRDSGDGKFFSRRTGELS